MTEAQVTVVEAVLQSVAEYTGTDVLDLPPLYDVIDPDALEKVTQKMERGEISFDYADLEITVSAEGTVGVTEPSRVSPTATG